MSRPWRPVRPRAAGRGNGDTGRTVRTDLLAGLTGAISRVPDGMAASVLAGVPPTHGLYASFTGPIAGGLTTSTRLMVVTTTSAAALAAGSAIAAAPAAERSDALLWLTLLAGGLMLVAAFVRLDRSVRFVSRSVMLGFLTGVAVNIVLGQLPHLVGSSQAAGSIALTRALDTVLHPSAVDPASAATGLAALLLLVLLDRTRLSGIGSLVALGLPTAAVVLLGWSTVARVADGGALPTGLPLPGLPDPAALDLSVVGGAAAVAVIILVQGAGVAEAAPNPDGAPSSPRRDFTAQGVANLAAGLFGGQPVGGSVGQTALNETAGARTRWAGISSGGWMIAILLLFAPLVGQVATPTLAAVLVRAGWGTIRPAGLASMVRAGRIPAVALVATFVAVLLLPVATAVGLGVAASLLLQLNQEALDLRVVRMVPVEGGRFREVPAPAAVAAGEVVVLDVYGSMLFAGARTLQRRLPDGDAASGSTVVLRLRGRATLGPTFLRVVEEYARRLEAAGGRLYLSGIDPRVAARWNRDGAASALGGVRVFEATDLVGEATLAALDSAVRVQPVPPPVPPPDRA